LGHLPFNALPGRKPNTFLIEDHRIASVAVPQLLPSLSQLNKPRPASSGLLLVGAVDYGKNLQGEAKPWQPLANGDREIADISKIYSGQFPDQQIQTLRGTQATESKVYDSISRFQIQHYSTHGFFEANPNTFGNTSRRFGERDYSGLVLANANQPRNYQESPREARLSDMFDDGRLTAEELTAGRMNSVELVFFSACNSGMGEVTSGEGLMGLQRAVQLAGVRSTIATLWHVDTDFSRLISTTFYRNLWSGVDQDGQRLSRLDALRDAQLAVLRGQVRIDASTGTVLQLKGPGASAPANLKAPPASSVFGNRIPPYYWAAYTLSGDWR
ncbi:MAG: CHAT domain-containing protein, partial [Planctomycetota bacterium]